MEVSAEAKRIMVVALGKLYSSRTQRGGLRLHRSLLLTMVMKSARDIYHAAQAEEETGLPECEPQTITEESTPTQTEAPSPPLPGDQTPCAPAEPLRHDAHTEQKENECPTTPTLHSRKRRGRTAADPDFLPCKKAKLEQGLSPQPVVVTSVLMDFVNCSSELGPPSIPLQRVIAAC